MATDISLESAKEMVRKEKDERGRACNQAIMEIMQKYQCELRATPFIDENGKVLARIQIVPGDIQ